MKKIVGVAAVIAAFSTSVVANGTGTNYLMEKIIEGDAGEVSLYLEGETSPDVRDSQGNPALVVATAYKRPQVVRVLLEWDANPNLTNVAGMTALMVAAQKKSLEIMRIVLQSKADVNLQNPQTGDTALMYAVQSNFAKGVQLLIDNQADVNHKNKRGINAQELARASGYTEIVQMLWLNRNTGEGKNSTESNSTAISTSISKSLSESESLLNQGNFSLAREVVKEAYQATGDMALLLKWLEVDKRLFQQLKAKNKRNAPSKRSDDSEFRHSFWDFANRRRQVRYEREHPISTLPLSEVDQVIEGYEQLKLSFVKLDKILPTLATSAKVRQLVSKHKAFVERVNQTHYEYITFDVISPYLGRADQQLFLSDHTYYFSISYSSDMLHETVKTLAKSTHQELIFDSYPIVKKQFVSVYKTLMELGGDSVGEFKEFRAIQAVADKLVPIN
ncbi:MAG: hypothetical protein DRR08_22025 [Candidatus Parabeggiatoa sp. nov. 2]|nr:MAG: hypothetical protein B6247_23945 [Beggiatoa sp. 4572_84]RKZ56334.1 MAG: hypothetical protein DRR08_22025 [Gammaproteobacteria bacterium]